MTREDLDDSCMRTEKLRSSKDSLAGAHPSSLSGSSGRCEKPEGGRLGGPRRLGPVGIGRLRPNAFPNPSTCRTVV